MSVPSAIRVLELVEWLAAQTAPVTLTNASQALGLPKSSTLLLLKALAEGGYVDRNERGSYGLIRLPGEQGPGHRAWGTIVRIAEPYLRKAVTEGQESGFIAVLTDELRIRYLNKILPDLELHYDRDISKDRVVHEVASGLAILSALPEAEVDRYLSSVAGSGPSTVDPDSVRAAIAETRSNGFAVVIKGRVDGASGVAAPVLDAKGWPVAAINLSGPTHRVINNFRRNGQIAKEAARQVSEELVRRQWKSRETEKPKEAQRASNGAAKKSRKAKGNASPCNGRQD